MRLTSGPRRAHLPGASRRHGHVRLHGHGSRRRLTSRHGHRGVVAFGDPTYSRRFVLRQTNAVSDPVVTADLLGRLDRLPMTRTARLTTVLLIVVWVAEGFEAGIIGPILLIV